MADQTTLTTDTYKDLLKAADAAFGKIGNWMKNTISNNDIYRGSNKTLVGSLQQIDDELKKIQDRQKVTKSFQEFVTLDKRKIEIEEQTKKIQDQSDFRNRKGWGENFKKQLDKGVDNLVDGAPDLLKMGMAAQTAQVSFQRLTGSSAAAAGILKDIHQMAATSLFNNDKLQENAATLLESGMAAEKLMPALNMMGDASGGNQTKLDALTKAFGDMQQAGHLTKESLKEMNDAGFKPLEIMAANSGQTMAQLQTSMEAGGISTDSVIGALQAATSSGGEFFGVMKEQSETAAGKWHYLQEKMSEAGGTIGNALMPTVSNFIDNTLMPLVDWLGQAAGWIAENSDLIGFLTTVVAGLVLGYKAWTLAAELLGPAMASSGIGAIFVAVGALVGIIIYCWNTFGWFRGAVMACWEVLKTFGTLVWDYTIEPIKDLISGLAGVAKAVWYIFSGDWSKAWEAGQQAVDGLSFSGTRKALSKDVDDIMGLGDKVSDTFNAEVNKKKEQTNAGPGGNATGNWQGNFGGGQSGGAGASGSWNPAAPGGKMQGGGASGSWGPVAPGGKSQGGGATGYWNPASLDGRSQGGGASGSWGPVAPGGKTQGGGATGSWNYPGASGSWDPDNARKKMSMDNTKGTVSGITNGGARTVNITMQKLFETINITTNTLSESIADMEQQVTDALLNILKQA